jgi:hypothetical protein
MREVTMELERLLSRPAPAGRYWPRAAEWREDAGSRFAVCRPKLGARSLELLAYGLRQLDGRELHLVLPRQAVKATRARAAFLAPGVHVHRSRAEGLGDAEPPMSIAEATAFYRQLGEPVVPKDWEAPGWEPWLTDLVDWVESRRVERVRNSEEHAWHYRGRQVFSVRRFASGGCELTAGANCRAPTGAQPAPIKVRLAADQELGADQAKRVRRAVDSAIERRRTGEDDKHREHLLQAAIGTEPSLIGMTELRREVPAWRPDYEADCCRAFIDFVGCDVDRVGHLIEVKIGPDAQSGIQALDHWAWAKAHIDVLSDQTSIDPASGLKLDIVLGRSDKELLHPAAAATLRALGDDVDWRCHLVEDWNTVTTPRQLLAPRSEAFPPRMLPTEAVRLSTAVQLDHIDGHR